MWLTVLKQNKSLNVFTKITRALINKTTFWYLKHRNLLSHQLPFYIFTLLIKTDNYTRQKKSEKTDKRGTLHLSTRKDSFLNILNHEEK